jgi:hypothetical protein
LLDGRASNLGARRAGTTGGHRALRVRR